MCSGWVVWLDTWAQQCGAEKSFQVEALSASAGGINAFRRDDTFVTAIAVRRSLAADLKWSVACVVHLLLLGSSVDSRFYH